MKNKQMKVPFFLPYIDNQDISEIKKIASSTFLTNGPKLEEFELEFKKFTNSKYAIGVSNATSALHISLNALGISKNDEVIVPEYSFIIYRIYSRMFGAKVRYAKEENFKPSVQSILDQVSRKTKIVFLANPNNPTGTYLDKFEILKYNSKLLSKS